VLRAERLIAIFSHPVPGHHQGSDGR